MTNASPTTELFENLRIELRSGCLILAVLGQLRAEHYGYSLRQALADAGLEIGENNRKKRFYRLSADGKRILPVLFKEWESIERALRRVRK